MQKYGQHFLIDQHIITQIVDAACLLRAENVVEIGPGKGALTRILLERGVENLTVVEIDPQMVKYLKKNILPQHSFQIIEGNFLKFNLASLPQVPTEFVSNLPYIDAAEILDKVLAWPHFKTAVFMFQKEQAQKIRAKAGDELYGPLSVFSQLRARISPICKVGRSCFAPQPKVESAVLAFEKITPPSIAWEKLRRVVTGAFLHRRKTLFNALVLSGFEKEKILVSLEKCGFKPTVRPEEISPENYVRLTGCL